MNAIVVIGASIASIRHACLVNKSALLHFIAELFQSIVVICFSQVGLVGSLIEDI